jgi:uncharacterized membrane protein
MTTKKVQSYTLVELNGMTKVTVQLSGNIGTITAKRKLRSLIWSQREEIAAFQAMFDKAPTSNAQVPTPASAQASPAVVPTPAPTSVAELQQDTKRHTARLAWAKDNPSITRK